jgi:hypothetical protein
MIVASIPDIPSTRAIDRQRGIDGTPMSVNTGNMFSAEKPALPITKAQISKRNGNNTG